MIKIILNQSFHCWKSPKTYCLFSFCGNFSRWQQLVFEDIVWTCKLICQDWLKAEGYLKLGVMHNSNIFVPTKISTLNNKEKYEVYLKSSCMLNQNIFSLCMASYALKTGCFSALVQTYHWIRDKTLFSMQKLFLELYDWGNPAILRNIVADLSW